MVSALSGTGVIGRSLFQMWLGDTQALINTGQKWYLLSDLTCVILGKSSSQGGTGTWHLGILESPQEPIFQTWTF